MSDTLKLLLDESVPSLLIDSLPRRGYVTKPKVAALGYLLEGLCTKVRNATNGSWWIIKVHPTLGDAAQKLRAKRAGGKKKTR